MGFTSRGVKDSWSGAPRLLLNDAVGLNKDFRDKITLT